MISRVSFRFTGFLGLAMALMLCAGCAVTRTVEEQEPSEQVVVQQVKEPEPQPEPVKQGVYHTVQPGQTLWRIAKTYQISLEQIVQANNIPNAARVEKGQLIFIPGAAQVLNIPIIQPQEENQKEFIWPIDGKIICYFNQPLNGYASKGIDILAAEGKEVKAARSGRVVMADRLSGQGHIVILDHEDGLFSVYSQNSKLNVKLGDRVRKNDVIALLGRNGDTAYLHFEIRRKSVEDNPLFYLP